MENRKYKAVYIARKSHKHFCKGDVVGIIEQEIVDAPAHLVNYNKLAILVQVDIFKKYGDKLIRYNGFKQHHNTTMFADLMLSFDKLSDKEIEEFYKKDKIFQNVIEES